MMPEGVEHHVQLERRLRFLCVTDSMMPEGVEHPVLRKQGLDRQW